MSELVFVYGTLMCPLIQWCVLGRRVSGRVDALAGFKRDRVCLGGVEYPNIVSAPGEVVCGRVIEVSREELGVLDRYETRAYRRVRVVLRSGRRAWVYIGA